MSLLTLDIEKPAVGGRMLARHDGQVVLVSGAIPGERVTARVVRAERRVLFAETVDVLVPSADRRPIAWDIRCGGSLFAHIQYARQLALKGEIITDALGRIGRMAVPPPEVLTSPEHGYRMRARFHVHRRRLGFYAEGTHTLCDPGVTGQLLPSTVDWMAHVASVLEARGLDGASAVEIAENRAGDVRAGHLDLEPGVEPRRFAALSEGLVGLSARSGDRTAITLAGTPEVTDAIALADGVSLSLRRGVRAFFQSNRYLLEPLVRHVVSLVPEGPVLDLYAGVGLFGLSLAAGRKWPVTLVEGDPASAGALEGNAAPFNGRVRLSRRSVEDFLAGQRGTLEGATVIVDPPRTGLSREACGRLDRLRPAAIVYVSCDVATLARDARLFVDAGYRLGRLSGIDLFPNTAHVESVALFEREG